MLREEFRAGRYGHILLDLADQVKAIYLSVLGHIGKLTVNRLFYGFHLHFFSVDLNGSGNFLSVAVSEQAHGKLGTPRAHQPGKPYYLARLHADINIL